MSADDGIWKKPVLHGLLSPYVAGHLARVYRGLCAEIDKVAEPHRLSHREWHMLDVLVRQDGIDSKYLATALGLSIAQSVPVLDNLVTGALAFRLPDRSHGHVLVHASERGRSMHRELSAPILTIEREAFSPLSFREFEALRQAFRTLRLPPEPEP